MLRKVSLITAIAGAIVSLGLMFATGNRPPLFLIILFVLWVAAPYAAFVLAIRFAKRWPHAVQTTLYWTTLVVTAVSFIIYINDVLNPPASTRAFVWVLVPAVSGLASLAVVSVSALIVRSR
jgi:hypothetical protein